MAQKKKSVKDKAIKEFGKLESEMVHINFTDNIGIEKQVFIKRDQLMERSLNEIISILLK